MRRGRWTHMGAVAAVAAALGVLGASAPAHAGDGVGVLVGYGIIKQKRLDFESQGHLISVGVHSPGDSLEDGFFASATFDFVIDQEYSDLTQLGFTFEGAYAFGSSFLAGYVGFAMRTSIDGYPRPSWSPMDPGAVAGFIVLMGPVGLGAEFRGWLGWNVYEDFDNRIEPYFDARLYLSVNFD